MNLDEVDQLAKNHLEGFVIPKHLVNHLRLKWNVPSYVAEYFLGRTCASVSEDEIQASLEEAQCLLEEQIVWPGEEELLQDRVRKEGSARVITRIRAEQVGLRSFVANLPSLGLGKLPISEDSILNNERLLSCDLYAVVDLSRSAKKNAGDLHVESIDLIEFKSKHSASQSLIEARQHFSSEQWIHLILRSVGFEPTKLSQRQQRLLLLRVVPFVQQNYSQLELGPRGTGKSYLFSETSPNASQMIGRSTGDELFWNVDAKEPGLICVQDVICIDEMNGNWFDKNGISLFKVLMDTGSFSRGKLLTVKATGSLVMVGNLSVGPDDVDRLFDGLPIELREDAAFLDRVDSYLPGWQLPRFERELATFHLGLESTFLAAGLSQLRDQSVSPDLMKRIVLGDSLNQRDVKSVRKTVEGLIKLVYPHRDQHVPDDALRWMAELALECRQRVKNQLHRLHPNGYSKTSFHFSLASRVKGEGISSIDTRNSGETVEEQPAFSSQLVVTRFPSPIAVPYRRFIRQREPGLKLSALFNAFESSIRFLFALAVSDFLSQNCESSHAARPLFANERLRFLKTARSLTLGDWVHALKAVVSLLADTRTPYLRELPGAFKSCGDMDHGIVRDLVMLRNESTHRDGSVSLTGEQAHEKSAEFRPMLDRFLDEYRFLCNYELGVAEALHEEYAEAKAVRVHSFMGATVSSGQSSFVMRVRENVHLRYKIPFVVRDGQMVMLYLWPLIISRNSELTGRMSLYTFEETGRKGRCLNAVKAISVDTGASDTWTCQLNPNRQTDFQWLLDDLTALPSRLELPANFDLASKMAATRTPELSNQKLGKYTLTRKIASGGFGAVYVAESTDNETVAVKVLEHPDTEARFKQEFRKLQQFQGDDGVIETYEFDFEVVNGKYLPWYSMEFAAGGDFGGEIAEYRSRAKLQNRLPWEEPDVQSSIVKSFSTVCQIVATLHDNSFVHRDIKPANILICDDGRLKISDFGLIKSLEMSDESYLLSPQTSTGAVLGTKIYMSPEQESGQEVDERTDVYALGILLAEMATGVRPVASNSAESGSRLADSKAIIKLPKSLRKLILQATDIDVSKRPENASRLLEKFQRFVSTLFESTDK